jgi:hypothetical protein
MGGPDEPTNVMKGGREPAGESLDVMAPGSPEREDLLERGRAPTTEEPDVLDSRER